MKLRSALALILVLVPALPLVGQGRSDVKSWAPDIWPGYWYGSEEFTRHTLPVGGWNTLGAFSIRSLAMGETYLSVSDGTAGYLNPALLMGFERPKVSADYRWSENAYRTSAWPEVVPMRYTSYGYGESRMFKGSADDLAALTMALPLGDWAVSASYYRFQDYHFPRINALYWSGLDRVEGSGGMRGVNLAVAARLTPKLSLGLSASYLFGSLRRVQVLTPIYYWFDGTVSPADPGGDEPPIWIWPSTTETYDLDMKGVALTFGAAFEPNEQWTFGLTLRPPFALDIDARAESLVMDGYSAPVETWGSYYEKQPLVAVGSVRYRPIEAFTLTADVSVWGWSGATSDYASSLYYSRDFRSVVKLNLGAEYRVRLPFPAVKDLFLRAGYIHDPQPYRYDEAYARDLFCAGAGLAFGPVEVGVAARLAVSALEVRRFRLNVIQAGASYRF